MPTVGRRFTLSGDYWLAEIDGFIGVARGKLVLDSCLVEAVSNTAFYVSGTGASLHLVLCILDGLESCQRAVHLASQSTTLAIDFCYVTDMFSLITSSNQETQNDVTVRITGSCLSDLQECLRVCLPQVQPLPSSLRSTNRVGN